MSSSLTIIAFILLAIGLFILWRYIKPYIIKYNTTLFITGELGSGKTLTAVKTAIILIRKMRFKVNFYNKVKMPLTNRWRKHRNKARIKKGKPELPMLERKRRPQLISNIPIHFKPNGLKSKREWSVKLNVDMLLLVEKIPEYSVVLVDELPQLVNQFNWDLELVQKNVNEFITFYRHYVGSYFICTSQAANDVVVQIRRKCNQAIWCYNMKKHLFGLFYTINMADMMLNDNIQSMSTTYIQDNTKKHFGLFPPKNTYDTRCFSNRYKNCLVDPKHFERWENIKTNEIIRLEEYNSPLDDKTTTAQKQRLKNQIQQLKTTTREERKANERKKQA